MFKKWDKYVLLHFVDNSNIKQKFSANKIKITGQQNVFISDLAEIAISEYF